MNSNRRDFLKTSAALTAAFLSQPASAEKKSSPLFPSRPLAIIQGPTSETQTQIAVEIPVQMQVRYEILNDGKKTPPTNISSHGVLYSPERIDKITFTNLEPGDDYELQIYDQNGVKIDEREFKTLDTRKLGQKVALLSCMNDGSSQDVIDSMWSRLKAQDPDQILFLGDNVYGDLMFGFVSGPEVLWKRYRKTRAVVPFYHWEKLVPVIAIWDDHDFGKNDAVGNYKNKKSSLDHFNAAYAQAEVPGFFEKGPGISSTVELFNHRFVFLDAKCWRGEDKMLGEQLLDWLKEKAAQSGQGLIVAMGSSIMGKANELAYETVAPEEFHQFQNILSGAGKPMLLVSGDLHYSDVSRVTRAEYGLDGYHITSSCMHSIQKKKMRENPNRVAATLKNNFVMLEIRQVGDYGVRAVGQDGVRFEERLKL